MLIAKETFRVLLRFIPTLPPSMARKALAVMTVLEDTDL
jgi:hypothetical protein